MVKERYIEQAGVRSSRKLETECERNIEMQWLCEKQVPCYHTIASFRTFKSDAETINHRKALKEVFRAFNRFLNGESLFGKETVATDGTKMRAQNAKKKNYTEEKLDKKIEISDATIAQYLDEMDEFDKTEALTLEQAEKKKYVETKLEEAKKWKEKFTAFKQELKQRQEIDPEVTQISLTDPDARSIVLNNSGHSEVAYNVVTAVDEKHKLIANFFADNVKDYVHLPKNACPNPLSKTAFQGKLKEPNTNKPVRIIKKGWLLWQVKSFTKNGKPSWSILSALSKGNGIALTPY